MSSVAKKLTIVQNDTEPAVEESVAGAAVEVTETGTPSGEPEARPEALRLLEAMLFAAAEPLDEAALTRH